jgi:hypothetical protein
MIRTRPKTARSKSQKSRSHTSQNSRSRTIKRHQNEKINTRYNLVWHYGRSILLTESKSITSHAHANEIRRDPMGPAHHHNHACIDSSNASCSCMNRASCSCSGMTSDKCSCDASCVSCSCQDVSVASRTNVSHANNRRQQSSKMDQETLDKYPLCRMDHSSLPVMDMLQLNQEKAELRHHIVNRMHTELGLAYDFVKDTPGKLTPRVLEQIVQIIDEEAFKGELSRIIRDRGIVMKYAIEHKPKENHSAVIYYKGTKQKPIHEVAVNVDNYHDCVGQINNGIQVKSCLENLEIDVSHELTHSLVYACKGEVVPDHEAHGPFFSNLNRVVHGHTKTYIQMK